MLWQILVQFLFRLAFGLAAAMLCTSPRWVTPGFYRVHLWVGLGINTFVAGIACLLPDFPARTTVLTLAITAAVLSYVGAVLWLYEQIPAGQWALGLVALVNFGGSLSAGEAVLGTAQGTAWEIADTFTAGLLLGSTLTAMLLGHWYLNTPSMQLLPLRRLVLLMALAVLLRTAISLAAQRSWLTPGASADGVRYALLALRWLAGLAGILGLAAMTWQTLKIPNTQSATGILYVAVIFAFLGELTAQLLSVALPPYV